MGEWGGRGRTRSLVFVVSEELLPLFRYLPQLLLVVVAQGNNQRLPLLSLTGDVGLVVLL